MATNDRFIQSIVELLDKLIDHQSRNASLLAELKSSLGELRSDATETLIHLREKLPETLSREQEENYRKLSNIVVKIEDNNARIAENIKLFEKNYGQSKQLLEENAETLGSHTTLLSEIKTTLSTKKEQQEELERTVKEVNQFITSIKSKKTWIALIAAGIAGLATMLTAIIGSMEAFKNLTGAQKATQTQSSPQTPNKP